LGSEKLKIGGEAEGGRSNWGKLFFGKCLKVFLKGRMLLSGNPGDIFDSGVAESKTRKRGDCNQLNPSTRKENQRPQTKKSAKRTIVNSKRRSGKRLHETRRKRSVQID